MKEKLIFCMLAWALISCNAKETPSSEPSQVEIKADPVSREKQNDAIGNSSINKQIIGTWTNQSSENAVFEVNEKSFYYPEQSESYNYSIDQDKIEIRYPDYTFEAKISFSKDTLIMDSEENGQTKYWRFQQ